MAWRAGAAYVATDPNEVGRVLEGVKLVSHLKGLLL